MIGCMIGYDMVDIFFLPQVLKIAAQHLHVMFFVFKSDCLLWLPCFQAHMYLNGDDVWCHSWAYLPPPPPCQWTSHANNPPLSKEETWPPLLMAPPS